METSIGVNTNVNSSRKSPPTFPIQQMTLGPGVNPLTATTWVNIHVISYTLNTS